MKSALLACLILTLGLPNCGGDDTDPQPPPTENDGITATATDGGGTDPLLPECKLVEANVVAYVYATMGPYGLVAMSRENTAGVEPEAAVRFAVQISGGETLTREVASNWKGQFEGNILLPVGKERSNLPVTLTVSAASCRAKTIKVVTPHNADGHKYI